MSQSKIVSVTVDGERERVRLRQTDRQAELETNRCQTRLTDSLTGKRTGRHARSR